VRGHKLCSCPDDRVHKETETLRHVEKLLSHLCLSECWYNAGGLRLWTHFDVMSNLLCQIRGTKQVRLWPPSEVCSQHSPFKHGSVKAGDILHASGSRARLHWASARVRHMFMEQQDAELQIGNEHSKSAVCKHRREQLYMIWS